MIRRWSGCFRLGMAVALTAGLISLSPVGALAAPLFTVQEGSVPGSLPNLVTGDRLTYTFETVGTQAFTGDLTGADDPFTEQGSVHVQSINLGATTPLQQLTTQSPSILFPEPIFYGMYAVFLGTGESEPIGPATDGSTGILGIFDSFALALVLDPLRDSDIDTVVGTVQPAGFADDIIIANATLAAASNCPADPSCGISHTFPEGVALGDFAVLLEFTLTPAGEGYFISPDPFYATLRVTGVSSLIGDITSPNTTTEGSGQGFFEVTNVPEPTSLLLLGAGLVGLSIGGYRRRK